MWAQTYYGPTHNDCIGKSTVEDSFQVRLLEKGVHATTPRATSQRARVQAYGSARLSSGNRDASDLTTREQA
jgi:hypothetical protein